MLRWWHELWNPKDKCKRVGHKPRLHIWRGLVELDPSRNPSRVQRQRLECVRCSEAMSEWEITKETYYHEITMPQDDWDQLEDTGELCEEHKYLVVCEH